jgi:hypothetical protein
MTNKERVSELEHALQEILTETQQAKDPIWKLVRIENIAAMALHPGIDILEYWTGDKETGNG